MKVVNASSRYYSSPTRRLACSLNERMDELLGDNRESFFHLVGAPPSVLLMHLVELIPDDLNIVDYGSSWVVDFKSPAEKTKLRQNQDYQREVFNWRNLIIKRKTDPYQKDLCVN